MYKYYEAIISQNNQDAPVIVSKDENGNAATLQDDFGNVTFQREDEGWYMITGTDSFPVGRTSVFITPSQTNHPLGVSRIIEDNSTIYISAPTDSCMNNVSLLIKVKL